MALLMVERPSGEICLQCNPPVVKYVPIEDYEEVVKERDRLLRSVKELTEALGQILGRYLEV